jgi:heme exporter protein D
MLQREPNGEASVTIAAQHGCAHGVDIIEIRTLIACGLILLLIAAALVAIALLRHNNYDRKIARQRAREQVRRDERSDAASRPD